MGKNDVRRGLDITRAGRAADRQLAGALLKMIAVGFAGGVALIAGAKKAGDAYLDAKAKASVDVLPEENEEIEADSEAEVAEEETEAETENEAEAEEEAYEPVPVVAELADDIAAAEDTEE